MTQPCRRKSCENPPAIGSAYCSGCRPRPTKRRIATSMAILTWALPEKREEVVRRLLRQRRATLEHQLLQWRYRAKTELSDADLARAWASTGVS